MEEEKQIQATIKILEMYNNIEMELLIMLARHFKINDEFINSDYWRIQKLQEMGLFNQDVINYIARYNKTTPGMVKSALNKLGIETYNIDRLNRAFEDEMISINPNILLENGVIQAIINTQYSELSNSLINMSQKIQRSVRKAYLDIVEETYLKTSMGTHSYQEAIRESINKLSNQGLKTLEYITVNETGEVIGTRTYNVEGAVRREILTNTRNLSNSINEQIVNELKPKYIKLSEHLRCRPQHFDWQGTIIEREKLIPITKYGKVDGLGGINCQHYFEPYFGENKGKEEKKYTYEQCEMAYKESQRQRYLERGVRNWQRKTNMYKANQDKKMYKKSKDKLKMWQDKYLSYCEKNDIKPDYTRLYTTIK